MNHVCGGEEVVVEEEEDLDHLHPVKNPTVRFQTDSIIETTNRLFQGKFVIKISGGINVIKNTIGEHGLVSTAQN